MTAAEVKSEITGNFSKIVAYAGEYLEEEQTVLIMESTKVEIPVVGPIKGRLNELLVKEGQRVAEGPGLALIET